MTFLLLAIVFVGYILFRNQLVYNYLMWVLEDETYETEERVKRFRRLPTYHTMLFQLTKFDWSEYLPDPEEKDDGEKDEPPGSLTPAV